MEQIRECKKPIKMKGIVHLAAWPIEKLVSFIKLEKQRHARIFHAVIGAIILMIGAFLATIQQHVVPHFVWEGVAYTIHGLGGVPLIKMIADWVAIEI